VGLLLFASGLCALVYQVAWLREFRLVFGASTAATAAVLAVFIGGLGAGGLLLGPRADRSPRPLALYGALELGAALLAALSPLFLYLVRTVYVELGAAHGWDFSQARASRCSGCFRARRPHLAHGRGHARRCGRSGGGRGRGPPSAGRALRTEHARRGGGLLARGFHPARSLRHAQDVVECNRARCLCGALCIGLVEAVGRSRRSPG